MVQETGDRPDPSPEPSGEPLTPPPRAPRALVLDVDAAFRALHSAVDTFIAAAADRYGVNRNDQHCLELLDRRGPLTAGELAEASGLSAAAVTKVVDRLLEAGYVRRTRAEDDRRRVIITTTDAEQRLARDVFGPLAAEGIRVLSELTDEQLQMLRDLLLRCAEVNMKHARRVRQSADQQR